MPLDYFHPVVKDWFEHSFAAATDVQQQAWPAIKRNQPTLIAAPTGSGKTLAAFMSAIDELVRDGMGCPLPDETRVLYVSPLKALSNDIQKNLQQPLNGIRDKLLENGLPDIAIRAVVRTGDTPQSERNLMRRQPPHILVTTPESLYILLTSESGRNILSTVRTVIVDEIHALAANKRGAHLALSLQRLDALCTHNGHNRPVRIGLSATQKPISLIAEFLTGDSADPCQIIDTGHTRQRDLALELTSSPLQAIMPNEVWEEIYDRLTQLIENHHTTLIFVNTRRLAERAARHLAERIGETLVTAHHGSLSRAHRFHAEQQLKSGKLKALVATASLELGIDIGDVDLVCQLGTPGGIATFLQRVGRSGHAVGKTPKGRLFPLTCDDLVECTALLESVSRDELDALKLYAQPLDVLAQHIVAEVASRDWDANELYQQLNQARPYHQLTTETFNDVIRMLADGFTTRRGRRGAYIHYDRVNQQLRARRGARLVAVTNGGAIPDQFDYDVILQPEGHSIGTLNEDFAFESLPGDIFQLGNTSYRMIKIEQGRVFVEDARGEPPNIPFWFGEAPGRSDELSQAVSRFREDIDRHLESGSELTQQWLINEHNLPESAAQQLIDYLAAAKAALSVLPSQSHIIFERFFDETGDMHLVIHSPYGSRLNRAWGLSLRKRFCRKFNFELQAAALEDSIVLSLGATHSFPLDEVAGYLNAESVREILIQALLDAPMFPTHWRWNANIALAVPRNRNGKKVPAYFQRNDAEDLVSVVFPDQLACFENIAGNREVPDHPLVNQTIEDCLTDLMDIDGLEKLLTNIHNGEVKIICKDLNGPSPLSQAILNARPYAFLDDTPAEERRTLAVQQRRFADPKDASELAQLDPAAIARVQQEAWPQPHNADELHDALVTLGFVSNDEMGKLTGQPTVDNEPPAASLQELLAQRRATRLITLNNATFWVAAERLHEMLLIHNNSHREPSINPVLDNMNQAYTTEDALREILRSRLEGVGPISVPQLVKDF
ncbi:MAG: DEAD/DEAH box helicase, partial [Gammaproteobacteria bacterium]